MSVVIESWRPLVKNTLRGFCRVRFPSGLIIDGITVHVGTSDGSAWCGPPGQLKLDPTGNLIRDGNGKPAYHGIITFATRRVRDNWSEQILDALRARYPDALRCSADKAA